MKKIKILLTCATLAISSLGSSYSFANTNNNNFTNDELYLIGWISNSQILQLSQITGNKLTKEQIDLILTAARDSVEGKKVKFDDKKYQELISSIESKVKVAQEKENKKIISENDAKEKKYIAEFKAKNKKAITTKSGVTYLVTKEGKGNLIKSTDTVNVLYKGYFIDGKVFDQSLDRTKPATFNVDGVIPGFKEVLTKAKDGSKITAVIPYSLAYGLHGNQAIPPASTLIFEIEVISHKAATNTKK